MAKYEYKGTTSIHHYKRKPPKDPWDTIGPIVVGLIMLFALASCFGG